MFTGGDPIPITGVGANAMWSDMEMHDAMQHYWSRFANTAQWSMWVFYAALHELGAGLGLGGIMFDDSCGNHRQGTAIFTDTFIAQLPPYDPRWPLCLGVSSGYTFCHTTRERSMPLRIKTGIPIPNTLFLHEATPALTAVVLDVPLIFQKQNQWCWAACTAMIARFLGLAEPEQCELANFLFARTKCCQTPSSPNCNRPATYEDVVRVYGHLAIDLVGPDNPLSATTATGELNAGRAFEVGWEWSGGGGHAVVAYGYTAQGMVLVRDPWNGNLTLTYAGLFWAGGSGRWIASYGRFRKN